jgi:hypothetical protein
MKKNIKFIIFIFFIIAFMGNCFLVQAVTPSNFLNLTWETINNSSISYQGKILASENSVIKFSIQPLIYSNNKYSDSSIWNYRWYINNEIKKEGKNIKEYRFRVPSYGVSDSYNVKVVILNGTDAIGEKEITVSIANPKIILIPEDKSLRIIDNTIRANKEEIIVKAIPFFLNYENIGALQVNWFVGGQKQTNNSDDYWKFKAIGSIGDFLNINVRVINNDNVFISGRGEINIGF